MRRQKTKQQHKSKRRKFLLFLVTLTDMHILRKYYGYIVMRMALFAMVEMTISACCHGSEMNEKATTATAASTTTTTSPAPIQFSQVQPKKMAKPIVASIAAVKAYTDTHSITRNEMRYRRIFKYTENRERDQVI